MERTTNFVDYFEIDLTSQFLTFLNDPADLLRAGAVSRSWRRFVIANGLCKKLWLRKFPQVETHNAYVVHESDGIIRLSDVASRNAADWETLEKEHKIYSSLLLPLSKPIVCPKDCLSFAVGASSTDRHLVQNVINTLIEVDRYPNGTSYWSSKGQSDPDVPEYVMYKLTSDISIVSEIIIRPFKAFWEPGEPVYSPKSVCFRFGHRKSIALFEWDVSPLEQHYVDKYVWTYTSPEFPMTQESCLQQFKLPEPVVCVGGVVQIELLGRAQRNEEDDLYYICLGHVKVMGHRLDPAYILERLQTGEIQLNYYPHSLNHVLQSFCDENKHPVVDELNDEEVLEQQGFDSLMNLMAAPIFEGPGAL